ncbi:MAG: aminotransferase class V-fold PLP-dependent enzyme [Anaerolineae bacterium]
MSDTIQLPSTGTPPEQILQTMRQLAENDVRWREGKTWSLVYHLGDKITNFLKEAYTAFFSENGLNPTAFPSLRKFETEVVTMTANLLGGEGQVVGNMTSGGTESILMAVKTARDWARVNKPEITVPEMILPLTAHPAFDKAAHYFSVRPVRTPVGEDFRADVAAVKAAVTPNTILIAGSAPAYPHGVVDSITELAQVAQENGLLFHTDACVGGFMLPFVRKLGHPVPPFDFSVPGVTSLSVDLHKYGYAAKGASLVLYRDPELRRYQFSAYTDWPGGIYASPTMTGTRPGGAIAAAWAIMHYLGQEGYLDLARTVMDTVVKLKDGINGTDGLKVMGDPVMSILAIGSDELDIYQVADELTLRGWHLDRQHFPPCLHLTVTPAHAPVADMFIEDLRQSVAAVKRFSWSKFVTALQLGLVRGAVKLLPPGLLSKLTASASALTGVKGSHLPKRSAAMYGMMAELPDRGDLNEMVLDILDQLTRPEV